MHSWLILLAAAAVVSAAPREHPRLIATDADIERAKSFVKSDERAKAIYERLVNEAAKIEQSEPVKYELIGPRLLDKSRRALDRIYTLALLHRITGEKKYRDRAVKEMRAAADFPDWNPSHFLDTAEMTHAFAIGYDWLYKSLTPEERRWIRTAIVEKGIKPALPIYQAKRWWTQATHNWNQVCNGGIGIGALAVAEDEPEMSEYVIREAVASIPKAMASYAPDGGWNEGPGYWHYATRYNVYFLAALETALGTDHGLSKLPGFDRAGHFRVYFSGPSNRTFNYADASDTVGPAEEMFWLARRFDQPVYAWQQHQQLAISKRAHALDLAWFDPRSKSPDQAGWPLHIKFTGVDTAFLRSSWNEKDMIFVGVKGGDNKANHSHLDLGQFVIDYGSTRFATDLGPDDYNLPQYFGKLRWTYYRLNTESHNTVLIDGANQDPKAAAPIRSFGDGRVSIDVTGAYGEKLKSWTRSVELKDRVVTIRDVIGATAPVEALWGMVTEADVVLDGRMATLSKDGKRMIAEIRSPEGARFDTVSTQPPAPQRQNEGTRKLVVRLPGKVDAVEIVVTLSPLR